MEFKELKPPYNWKRLSGLGLSNDLFILNEEYFVKKSKTICHKFLNLPNQLKVIKLVQYKGYTLPIVEAKISDGHLWVLMPYYQNIFTYSQFRHYPELLLQIAQLVKLLHATPVTKDIATWNGLEKLELFCSLVKVPKNIKKLKTELTNWLKTYQPKDIVLCHNDLIGDNFIISNNNWYIVDWDFTCLNDRLFDIASFVSETLTREDDIKHWYELFNVSKKELEIINQWIKYQNLIWYHWAWYLYKATKDKSYKTIAQAKWKKLEL